MENTQSNRKDLSVSMLAANLYSLIIGLPLLLFLGSLFAALWGGERLWLGIGALTDSILLFLLILAAGIVIHEAIHGLAWSFFARRPLREMKFGIQWSTLTPYAHCPGPTPVTAYRLGALMPGLLLGILPAVAGIISGSGFMLAFGLLFTFAAGGDFTILWLLRKVPEGRLVEDHPTRAGCYVLE